MSGKLGYLGPEGTYSQEAAKMYNSMNMELVPYSSIIEVFNAVNSGIIDEGIVPLENSIEGSVNVSLDLLSDQLGLNIIGEVVLEVDHCLVARPGLDKKQITGIVSHPQALAQCRNYLGSNLPGIPEMKVNSTSEAARIAAYNSETWAAIANIKAAELYGLVILDDNIQDCPENKTRFVILSKNQAPLQSDCKTSIFVSITDRPGGLYYILKEFALRNINLTRIESRPAKKSLGDYIFYIEMLGHQLEPVLAQCLKAVEKQVVSMKVVGSYPAALIKKAEAKCGGKNNLSLEQIRADIDIIDNQIIDLLAQRTGLVSIVGSLKKSGSNIKDSNREKEVLTRLKNTAVDKGFDPEVTVKLYNILFEHFVNLQHLQHKVPN